MYVGLTHDVHLHLSVLEHVHVETTEMGTTSMTFTSLKIQEYVKRHVLQYF